MFLRKYHITDLEAIGRIDSFFPTQAKYHANCTEDNIICLVDDFNTIIGFGCLMFDQTFGINDLKKQNISFFTAQSRAYEDNYEVYNMLIDGLISRFLEIKSKYKEKELCLRICFETDEIRKMHFFLTKGFQLKSVVPVMKYDLLKDVNHYPIPSYIKINEYDINEFSVKDYMDAEALSNELPATKADLLFSTGDPSFTCFAATYNNELVGAISIWNISHERAATENIFVVPKYRRKNIAKELISIAFEELKKRDMRIASLSMFSTNTAAMNLYLSIGYTLYYNLIEMVHE